MQEVRLGDDPEPFAATPAAARRGSDPADSAAAGGIPRRPPRRRPRRPAAAPPAPAPAMGASAAGASYGDLLAPPPSYADSMMWPPEGVPRGRAASRPRMGFPSPSQSRAGMMRTVALDPGGGGESLGDGEPPVGPRGGESAARAELSGEIVEAEDSPAAAKSSPAACPSPWRTRR